MPSRNQTAFCPYCRAYAQYETSAVFDDDQQGLYGLSYRRCLHCSGAVLYYIHNGTSHQVFPIMFQNGWTAPDGMPEPLMRNFNEAAMIASASPRAAAALLRLCIQQLCVELGESGTNLNADIKSLVAKGLAPTVQQMLDTVRVIGNAAVHPNDISIEVDEKTVQSLFWCVSMIVFDMITKPNQAAALFAGLPVEQQTWIAQRDGKPVPAAGFGVNDPPPTGNRPNPPATERLPVR